MTKGFDSKYDRALAEVKQTLRIVESDEIYYETSWAETDWKLISGLFSPYEVFFSRERQICLVRFNFYPGIPYGTMLSFMARDSEEVIIKVTQIMHGPNFVVTCMFHDESQKQKLWNEVTKHVRHDAQQVG